ncbi:M48 family metalloprotease [Motilimonas cestriensis]|uniref:beta-barrel assembly-enhancing protease n=1 Tax=Motilimonas cestriensis TaxID=2742685 RepID=UPI001E63C440|nr:M48 family metalloprotease [Motilimonas cestriensis]
MLTSSSATYANLPEIGTAGASALTINKEIQYGKAFSVMARGGLPVVDDPVLVEYINDLGHTLVAHADSVKFPFNFFLIQDNEINAAAFFGGYVKIHTGLFLYADNESQLASVIAHEIAHVTQRHLARMMEAQSRSNPATLAAMAGSLLLTLVSPEAGIAMLQTTVAANMQASINYTRTHEFEADRIGINTLSQSGFDPREMAGFFGKLSAQYRYASKPPQMLLTHPLPETRVAESRNRAAQFPSVKLPASLPYQLAKARIEARYSSMSGNTSLSFFNNQLKNKDYSLEAAALYGKSLALIQMDNYPEADKIIDELLAQSPRNLFYIDVKTDLDNAQNRHQQAIERLAALYKEMPNNSVVVINLINTYMEKKDFAAALTVLDKFLRQQPDNTLAWSMAIKVNQGLGNLGKAYQARAEYLALHGDYKKAINELTSAAAETNNNLDRARIDARIEQFKQAQASLDELRS